MHSTSEDLAGRKQLPLRQQKDKPVLKYNGVIPTSFPNGPVHLFNQADLVNQRNYQNQPFQSSKVSQTPLIENIPPNHCSGSNYYFGSSNGTSDKVRTKNPYARPLSAKDLEPPSSRNSPALKKNASSSSLLSSASNSSGNSSGRNMGKSFSGKTSPVVNQDNFVQTNTFLRPRSSYKTESTKMSAQGFVSDLANTLKLGAYCAQTRAEDDVPKTTLTELREEKEVTAEKKSRSISLKRDAEKSAIKFTEAPPNKTNSRSDFHSVTNQETLVKDTNSPVKEMKSTYASVSDSNLEACEKDKNYSRISKVVNSKPPLGTSQIKSAKTSPNQYVSPTSKKTEVHLNVSSALSITTHGHSRTSSVRNPNYTPNKPYSEVNSVVPTQITPKVINTKPPSPTFQTMAVLPMPPSETPVPKVKMPVTNTITGTVFYKKNSKGDDLFHDLTKRPRADGASSASKVLERDHSVPVRKQTVPMPVKKVEAVKPEEVQVADDDDDDEWESEEEGGDDSMLDVRVMKQSSISVSDSATRNITSDVRMPGDGQADVYDDVDDDDDDEAMDGIEDDDAGDSDVSDSYTIATCSSSSSRQGSARVKSATKRMSDLSIKSRGSSPSSKQKNKSRPLSAVSTPSDTEAQPALMPSLFPNVPPTVNFVGEGQKVDQLPWDLRKMLKWKMSTITPNVVKNCISRIGFRATKKNHDWIGYWGKHMKAQGFKTVREYQKLNHFPGSFQIGRKDRLWRNLSRMQAQYGKRDYGFFPQTFVLPFDMKQLKRVWEDSGNKQKWIIKPPASARGIGIKVIHKWNQIPKKRPVIVQKYLSRPYLINDSKFDLRVYVYVSCYDPLRIYVYHDGLVRFASQKYSNSMKSLSNKYMHLTNYSINKNNSEYESNTDENVCQGHKWGLIALWGYLKKKGINTHTVWESIKDLIVKTIISSESCVNSLMKANVRRRYCCHELFGFDVMLDENLKPWIIEVNISPSLHSNSPLDINIKGGMIKDLFNIAGFMIPDKNDVTAAPGSTSDMTLHKGPANEIVIDKRLWPNSASPDERSKKAFFCQRYQDEDVQSMITDTLTPDDIRILVESIDEDSRRGNFERAFPTPSTGKYLKYFEAPRYYNLLLDAWIQKYNRMEHRGISLLENFCAKDIHLQNPSTDPKHQWTPPVVISRESRVLSAPPNSHNKIGSASLPKVNKKNSKLKKSAHTGSSSSLGSAGNTPRPTPPKSTLVTPSS